MFGVITDSMKFTPKRISKEAAIRLLETTDPWWSSDYHIYKEFRYDNGNWAEGLWEQKASETREIIQIHNRFVKPNDTFGFLGDWSESELTQRPDVQKELIKITRSMNGVKILFKGNNDAMPDKFYYDCGFVYVFSEPWFSQKYQAVFDHYPYDICSEPLPESWISIHGHIHGSRNYWNMDWHRHIDVYPRMNGNKPMKMKELRENYAKGVYNGKTTYHQQLR